MFVQQLAVTHQAIAMYISEKHLSVKLTPYAVKDLSHKVMMEYHIIDAYIHDCMLHFFLHD